REGVPAGAPAGEVAALDTPVAASVVETLAPAHPGWDVQAAGPETGRNGKPPVPVADAESWPRHWALWQRVRSHGEVL
ncbi:hypothetical protein, partial [Microbacterium sp. GbtcB4]|uniref:hypothetical protein n=1 Tax=Microbacterium sp. GbtcB4 TaxID=2824749 RepID=UPI001C2F2D46